MPKGQIEYNGTTFYRDDRGYYGASGDAREDGIHWLHREVWRDHNGEIPEGHVIHHKDDDPSNNDIGNLECLSPEEHAEQHPKWGGGAPRAAIEAAREWHQSEEGREWHAKHWERTLAEAFEATEKVCQQCGELFPDLSPHDGAKFCTDACKAKHRRQTGVDDEDRECGWCGDSFTANKYSDTRTCSRSCGAQLRWHG